MTGDKSIAVIKPDLILLRALFFSLGTVNELKDVETRDPQLQVPLRGSTVRTYTSWKNLSTTKGAYIDSSHTQDSIGLASSSVQSYFLPSIVSFLSYSTLQFLLDHYFFNIYIYIYMCVCV